MPRGTQIVSQFVDALYAKAVVHIQRTSLSINVFEYCGRENVLLYIKGRGAQPYRWGITANVIARLQSQTKPWVVILLFESHETGYLLTSHETEDYISQNIWPLAKDGDYKPASGAYLVNNRQLCCFDEFIIQIEDSFIA